MLKEALGRRGLFRRMGIGALLIGTAPQEVAKLAGIGPSMVLPLLPSAVNAASAAGVTGQAINAAKVFNLASDFSGWWKEFGKVRAWEHSAFVQNLDADIAGFRLPLGTKLRMQRERNYSRIKAHMRADFLRQVLRGSFHEWGANGPQPGQAYGGQTRSY